MERSKEKIIVFYFLGILLAGLLFRLWKFGSVPSGFFSDEIALAINAKLIAEHGIDEFGRTLPFGFESFSDYKLPGYIYLSALLHSFLPPSVVTTRLPAALAGLLSIYLIAELVRFIYPTKKRIALICAAVLSVSVFHIVFARIAYETMLSLAFGLAAIVTHIRASQKNEKNVTRFLVVSLLFAIYAMWTYHAMRLILPIWFVVSSVYSWIMLVPERKKYKNHIIMIFIGLVCAFLPYFLNPEIDSRARSYLAVDILNLDSLRSRLFEMIASFQRSLNLEFLFLKGDWWAYRHGTKENGVFPWIFLIPYLIGIWVLTRDAAKKQTRAASVLVLFLLVLFGLPSATTMQIPYGPRFLPMVIPLAIIIALGFDTLAAWLIKQTWIRFLSFSFLFFIFTLYSMLSVAHIYFGHYPVTSRIEFQGVTLDMIDSLPRTMPTGTRVYFINRRFCQPWGHDVLKLWYLRDLPIDELIRWNNDYREKRYEYGDPFNAYENVYPPELTVDHYSLFREEDVVPTLPSGTFIVRCGYTLPDISREREEIVGVFYKYEHDQREPGYVVSWKR